MNVIAIISMWMLINTWIMLMWAKIGWYTDFAYIKTDCLYYKIHKKAQSLKNR